MAKENISHEFRLKSTDETRSYFIEKINQNDLMSKKQKKSLSFKSYWTLNIFASVVTERVSISFFASLVVIPIGITASVVEFKICTATVGIEKYKSIIKKKKHHKTVLLAKTKLNTREVLISKTLIDPYITYHEF